MVVTAAMEASSAAVHLSLPLPPAFSLLKAVCSYGFFMTAPNVWIPISPEDGSLERPLRLAHGQAMMVRLSQIRSPQPSSTTHLDICVRGVDCLSHDDRDCILAQVMRMLRLSEVEESSISIFNTCHPEARAKGFGRLFRSPTLFEDMVKSLLLCNCGWSRTLGMAKAMCQLQRELKDAPLGLSSGSLDTKLELCDESISFQPKTPEGKDFKRKRCSRKLGTSRVRRVVNLTVAEQTSSQLSSLMDTLEESIDTDHADCRSLGGASTNTAYITEVNAAEYRSQTYPEVGQVDSVQSFPAGICAGVRDALYSDFEMSSTPCHGAFPTPGELAGLDENYLAKRCGLGYRAKRIWKLARSIDDGVLNLESLEEEYKLGHLPLEDLRARLLQLEGFGPFTCANVLMCMGAYEVVPADSETVRHLKQVHGRSNCTVANVSREVADVYAKYAPFQFLAYWFELWSGYEKRFGQLSNMASSDYGRITGHNMRQKVSGYFLKN